MKDNLIKCSLLLFVWVLFLPFLSGCNVETAHAPEDEMDVIEELVATPTAAATATFMPNTAVIFKRSGGLAGLDEEWIIFTDGRIETNSTIQSQLTAEEVEQLLHSLEVLGFFELEGSYLPKDTCCDRFLYEITAVQASEDQTVVTLESTPDMPEALQQTLRLLQTALFANTDE
jgi:hypothetical protein